MMMLQRRKLPVFLLFLTIIIVLCDLMLVHPQLYQQHMSLLTLGISLDFVIVIPILIYILTHQRFRKNISILAPLALLGYCSLLILLPSSAHDSLQPIKYIIIAIEFMFLSYGSYRLVSAYQKYKSLNKHSVAPAAAFDSLSYCTMVTFDRNPIFNWQCIYDAASHR